MANAERVAAEAVVHTVAEAALLTSTVPPEKRASPLVPPLPISSPCSDSDKKLHNGWGGDDGNAELKVEEAANFDAAAESGAVNDWATPTADTPANDWAAPADTAADDWGAPQDSAQEQPTSDAQKPDTPRRRDRDQDEEDNTLTLDQYLAQQKEKESALLPKLETRKANEGEATAWNDAVILEKTDDAYFSGKVLPHPTLPIPTLTSLLQSKSAPKARTEKKEKVYLEIDAHFERPTRGGRGRGDRGEGRGRGRSRGRGDRGRGANGSINVDDKTAFPSLS